MPRFLLFAGTTEGRRAAELLARLGCETTACAATGYGCEALPALPGLTVRAGRLDGAGIAALLAEGRFDGVIDATHPYAAEATRQIRAACRAAGVRRLRVLRAESAPGGWLCVRDAAEAARALEGIPGRVLLTTGSKELEPFAAPGLRGRVCPRVLPTAESLQKCLALGFPPKNIVCMQGPFSEELNLATLRQLGASCLVTTESGAAGGFPEKCAAARRAGARLVVVGRPPEEDGVTLEELPRALADCFGLAAPGPEAAPGAAPWFPLFVPLAGRRVVVVGAGAVARRRVETLLPFGAELLVVAPEADEAVARLAREGRLAWLSRPYEAGDCAGAALAVAAAGDRDCNRRVAEECRAAGVPVSVADRKEDCTFYFPGVARRGNVVVGVTASGAGHRLAREVTGAVRAELDRLLPGEGETR